MTLFRARILILLAALAATLALPFALRPKAQAVPAGVPRLVILSPHNEATRHEFGLAFRAWHRARYGSDVAVDWRSIGGTSEIVRYLNASFEAADRAGLPGIGVDLFFGGGGYDHAIQADKGHAAPAGLRERHPDWLDGSVITQRFSGEIYYDPADRWYGCCLSSFGICYNRDILERLGIPRPPARWSDLADPAYFRRLALADPTKSGSINKAFEMLIQQQMREALPNGTDPEAAAADDLAEGWRRALALLRRVGANARYFTDSAGKVPLDVAQGDAAAGMCIDFYGRFESETIRRNENSDRLVFVLPEAGSSVSVDPVSILRGAPNRELAERFVDFTLGEDGQKLWNYRAGAPGGPVKYALRRLPIRKDAYTPENRAHMSDPDADPYAYGAGFVYQPAWTGPLFGFIRLLIRGMCLDPHDELMSAWAAILAAGGPDACPEAMRALEALPPNAEYAAARDTAKRMRDKVEETRITREWFVFFRNQYRLARRLVGEVPAP
jgi:ABC-type Fe3+ transport system substrate-binding protein